MATRDLYADFEKLRAKNHAHNPHHQRAVRGPGLEPDGVHLKRMGDDVEESLCGGDKPDWTVIVDNVRGRFDQLENEFKLLKQSHQSQLRQGVDVNAEREKQERTAALTDSITAGFAHCNKWINLIVQRGAGDSQDYRVRKNVQVALATKLQKLSATFHKNQRRFMKQLHDQSASASRGDDQFQFLSTYDEDEDVQFISQFSEDQINQIATLEDIQEERGREINAILKSVTQLKQIFEELSLLVIDSGTILDRIDFNMEMVVENVHEAEHQLEKAASYNGKGLSAWCIIFLIVMCIIMTLVVAIKKGTK